MSSSEDKILVVEHLQIHQQFMQTQLHQFGHSFDIVGSGQAALDALMANRYKLIFMEVDLPGMNGIALTKSIRQTEAQLKWPHTPIIAYLHNDSDTLRQQCLDAGMDAFYMMPGTHAAPSETLALCLQRLIADTY